MLIFFIDIFVGFDQTSYTVKESEDSVLLVINVIGVVDAPLSLSYSTVNGTAVGE